MEDLFHKSKITAVAILNFEHCAFLDVIDDCVLNHGRKMFTYFVDV